MKRRRQAGAWKVLLTLMCTLVLVHFTASRARASFVGDLVFCDTDGDGLFEPADGDYGLNGVGVRITCETADGVQCVDFLTETGMIHSSAAGQLSFFSTLCANPLNWDPFGDLTGRYLFEVYNACAPLGPRPWTCTLTVDSNSLPDNCNALITPRTGGPPSDGNSDGDLCDPEDGPFPEGQPLGNLGPNSVCQDYPDAAPADGAFTVTIYPDGRDGCSIYNDFGFSPPPPEGESPGFWGSSPRGEALACGCLTDPANAATAAEINAILLAAGYGGPRGTSDKKCCDRRELVRFLVGNQGPGKERPKGFIPTRGPAPIVHTIVDVLNRDCLHYEGPLPEPGSCRHKCRHRRRHERKRERDHGDAH